MEFIGRFEMKTRQSMGSLRKPATTNFIESESNVSALEICRFLREKRAISQYTRSEFFNSQLIFKILNSL